MPDFLGRVPVPLRRTFKNGLDQCLAGWKGQSRPECGLLGGGEWTGAFASLPATPPRRLPGMIVSTFGADTLKIEEHYAPSLTEAHPACVAARLTDPAGVFRLFAVIPFVFLVDTARLAGRPAPRVWADLLHPRWAGDVICGGWRPDERGPYREYNEFLLLALLHEFGPSGLAAFGANVRHLRHNVSIAAQAGSDSPDAAAVAVLPWLQAEMNPRRGRTRVIWPEDGALALPLGYMVRPDAETRLRPLIRYVTGAPLARKLAQSCYPPASPHVAQGFPPGARLKWPGWSWARGLDHATAGRQAAAIFFRTLNPAQEELACG